MKAVIGTFAKLEFAPLCVGAVLADRIVSYIAIYATGLLLGDNAELGLDVTIADGYVFSPTQLNRPPDG